MVVKSSSNNGHNVGSNTYKGSIVKAVVVMVASVVKSGAGWWL